MLQVLIDADNLPEARIRALLRALPGDARIVVAGSPRAIGAVAWPVRARVLSVEGWQQADAALAGAYVRGGDPLVLASGDGDFALLLSSHPGPVLVVADRPSVRLRDAARVVDPVTDGLAPLRDWLDAVAG